MKSKNILKKVISPLIFSLFLCCPNMKNTSAESYDDSLWKNYRGESVASIEGIVTAPSGGMFYHKNLADQSYYEEHNALYVKLEFETTKNDIQYLANQVVFFINTQPMSDMSCIQSFGTQSSTTMGPRVYLQNEEQYNTDQVLFRLSDYQNYQTSTYSHISTGDVHSFSWLIDSTGVYTYFDDKIVTKSGSSYKSQKSPGVYWNLNDFLDKEGNPQVYAGVYTSANGWMKVGVKRIINSDGLTPLNGFKGNSENLFEKEGETLLENGFAYATESLDLSAGITGEFEVANCPGYKDDLATDDETFASITLKDSNKNDTDGNGFKITLYPLSITGSSKTKIEFGYISNGTYTALKSIFTNYPIIGNHRFGFVSNNDSYTLYMDGETYCVEIFSDPKIMTMDIKFGRTKTYVFYSMDNKFETPYSENWVAKLTLPHVLDNEDFHIFGNCQGLIQGDSIKSKTTINSKEYEIYTENKEISFENVQGMIGFVFNHSLPIYSKVNNLFSIVVSLDDIDTSAELTLFFSAIPGGTFTKDVVTSCFMIKIKLESESTASVHSEMNFESADNNIDISNKKMEISFGWENNKSIIKIDGNTVQVGTTGTGGFATADGLEGFFSAKYFSNNPISFKVSAPTQILSEIEEDPTITSESTISNSTIESVSSTSALDSTQTQESTAENTNKTNKRKGCKSSVIGCGISLLMCFAILVVLNILKRRENLED